MNFKAFCSPFIYKVPHRKKNPYLRGSDIVLATVFSGMDQDTFIYKKVCFLMDGYTIDRVEPGSMCLV